MPITLRQNFSYDTCKFDVNYYLFLKSKQRVSRCENCRIQSTILETAQFYSCETKTVILLFILKRARVRLHKEIY